MIVSYHWVPPKNPLSHSSGIFPGDVEQPCTHGTYQKAPQSMVKKDRPIYWTAAVKSEHDSAPAPGEAHGHWTTMKTRLIQVKILREFFETSSWVIHKGWKVEGGRLTLEESQLSNNFSQGFLARFTAK